MKKKLVLGLILIIALGTAGAFVLTSKREGETSEDDETRFVPAAVTRGPIRLEVTSDGSIESNLDVEIKCKASGEIVTMPFDVSDPVEKGDLLLELDPIDEERNVRRAEVSLAASQARLAQARKELEISLQSLANSRREAQAELKAARVSAQDKKDKAQRMTSLLEKKYASPEEEESARVNAVEAEVVLDKAFVRLDDVKVEEASLELLRQDILLAECNVESDQIALDDAKQRLKETKVYAPLSGVVSTKDVQVGQIISSPTNNVSGGTALMTVSDLSRLFVLASVDESDIGAVEVGQEVLITADAFPDERFGGKVVRVATKGDVVSNVVTFEVKIEVLGESKSKLLPLMTADVDILVASNPNALVVPSDAVVGHGPRKFLLMPGADGAEPERIPVEVGIDDGSNTEILSGAEEGDTVLVPNSQPDSQWMRGGQRGPGMGGPPGMGRMMRGMGGPPPR